ncbi:MAG: helix-turn-helix transcriptional regulator [Bacteroidota bacterium]
MTFGERLTAVRKRKKLSQADIGKLIGINGDAYGRYERNEVKPTIEMATKIANALEVSLDYLVGKTDLELDTGMPKRIEAVTKMDEKNKEHVFSLLDAFIAKTQMQKFVA